jgi:Replication stress response SDE2 C-terminal
MKCGGTLEQRAERLMSVKGLKQSEIDPKASLYFGITLSFRTPVKACWLKLLLCTCASKMHF